jgi:uncharacterized protein with NAD-binding domain and iron-sulfur cluster
VPGESKPQKIVILGGGVAAMTVALRLTEAADWKSRFDITIYQQGWRLGGKGASGRGPHNRIEEHGLHIWLGFYENAFRLIQQVYAANEKNRSAGAPLRTWAEAFEKQSFACIEENVGGQWKVWPETFPTDDRVPGNAAPSIAVWDYVVALAAWLRARFLQSPLSACGHSDLELHEHASFIASVVALPVEIRLAVETSCVSIGLHLIETIDSFTKSIDTTSQEHTVQQRDALLVLLDRFIAWLWARVQADIDSNDETRRLYILMDLGVATIRGLIRDGVIDDPRGLDILEEDFQLWLKRHGAADISYDIQKSSLVRGFYDLGFAYRDGDYRQPSFAAGPALRSVLRLLLFYKGAIFWKMQAGMGDTIFAPIYTVLKDKGVKFEFFHRVDNLALDAEKKSIASIRIARQVYLKDRARDYDPLFDCQGLPCWPSAPLYDQIENGDELRDLDINLESFWTTWQDVEARVLQAGVDFDTVVLGISLGSLPYICSELIAASFAWQRMVSTVETIRTMALQLWTNRSLSELGWTLPSPILDAYVEPLNTWADMTHLIPRESWPSTQTPRSIAYFCGQMPGGIPPREDKNAPARELAKVRQTALSLLTKDLYRLWPSIQASGGTGFNWTLLLDDENRTGEARLDAQYLRCNIDPSERYVLAAAGSTQARLRVDQSGFSNLVLTGDWTNNGFNVGCVEAATMSGIEAANTILGLPLGTDILALPQGFG